MTVTSKSCFARHRRHKTSAGIAGIRVAELGRVGLTRVADTARVRVRAGGDHSAGMGGPNSVDG